MTDRLGMNFARLAIAKALASGVEGSSSSISGARRISDERYGETSHVSKAARGEASHIMKTEVAAASAGNWGAVFASAYQDTARQFFGARDKGAVIGRLRPFLRQLPPFTPFLTSHGAATAAWVKEGAPRPVTAQDWSQSSLSTLKVSSLIVTTKELLRSEDDNAEVAIFNDLVRATIDASDLAFLDPSNAGVLDERPKSVTNGLTPVVASGDFKADLERLVGAFGGDLTRAFLIARPELFIQISGFDFASVGARGGEVAGIPALASQALPNDGSGNYRMILLDPSGIAYCADEGATEIETSKEAALELLTNPTNSSSPDPTPQQLVSLWQTGCVAMGVLTHENWKIARAGSVSLMSGIAPSVAPAS